MNSKTLSHGVPAASEGSVLGEREPDTQRASAELEKLIDDSLGLQAISIRLPKGVIETYKMLAQLNGVGYQPLMRDAICRWAEAELKLMLIGAVEANKPRLPTDAATPSATAKRTSAKKPVQQSADAPLPKMKKAA